MTFSVSQNLFKVKIDCVKTTVLIGVITNTFSMGQRWAWLLRF